MALLVLAVAPGFAQVPTDAAPAYARVAPITVDSVQTLGSSPLLVYSGAGADSWQHATNQNGAPASPNFSGHPHSNPKAAQYIFGVNSLPVFTSAFAATGGPKAGQVYPFVMIGNNPMTSGTTTIPTKITTVDVQLLNADGSVFKTVPYAPFEQLTLQSPNFEAYNYADGRGQFADAEQRAAFWATEQPSWHTNLAPSVVNRVTLTVPFFVNVRLSNGSIIQARSYFTGAAADGSTFILMLNLLFNFLYDNQVVADINAGNDTTDALNVQAWPNTFLFNLNTNNPNTPGGCCTLGFHTYFSDNGVVPQNRWVTVFASWISPGLFGAGFQDVTAMSHEISESFNDPFVNTAVPNWQFPGEPANSKVCQANLETGDPIEVLAAATVAIPLRNTGQVYTYHPQNEALWQWFTQGPSSNAFQGSFSFPDASVLPQSAIPCPP